MARLTILVCIWCLAGHMHPLLKGELSPETLPQTQALYCQNFDLSQFVHPSAPPTTLRPAWSSPGRAKSSGLAALLLELLAYPGWEQQPPPWLVATAMKYVGFPYFDRLWPPTSHEQHCKSRDAKYLHLEDVEVKWRFLTILRAISEQTKWPKGSIPRSIASMMYAEHVLRVDVDWSTFCTEGFRAIGPGLLAKRPIHIPYVPVPEWFRNDPKLYVDLRAQERLARAVGGCNGLMEVTDMQVIVFHSRNGSHLRGRLPRWRKGCRRMLMPRWRPCASSTTSTFRPTRLELSTLKQCWHLLEFANL